MTNTHTISRSIVAAIDPDGTLLELRRCKCPKCLTGDPYTKRVFNKDKPYDEWPRACMNCDWEGLSADFAFNVPDLAQPENLHLLCAVADGLGEFPCEPTWSRQHKEWVGRAWKHRTPFVAYGPTRSLAVRAAVCAALGIDTTQENEEC